MSKRSADNPPLRGHNQRTRACWNAYTGRLLAKSTPSQRNGSIKGGGIPQIRVRAKQKTQIIVVISAPASKMEKNTVKATQLLSIPNATITAVASYRNSVFVSLYGGSLHVYTIKSGRGAVDLMIP